MTTTILLADSHRMFREGIRRVLEAEPDLEVVAEAGDGEEAVRLAVELGVDIAVLETSLPKLTGIDAVAAIARQADHTRCVALSASERRRDVEVALRAGAAGYVVKSASASELLEAIRLVCDGKSYLSPGVTQHLVDAIAAPSSPSGDRLASLTAREREVLQLIAEGGSSKEIASELGVSTKTVDSHRSRLMQKLEIHKASALVRFAIREGLVAA